MSKYTKRYKWIYQYKCGCSDGPKYKSEMLPYCGKHGSDLQVKYAVSSDTKIGKSKEKK
jgi:hypothetical protein